MSKSTRLVIRQGIDIPVKRVVKREPVTAADGISWERVTVILENGKRCTVSSRSLVEVTK